MNKLGEGVGPLNGATDQYSDAVAAARFDEALQRRENELTARLHALEAENRSLRAMLDLNNGDAEAPAAHIETETGGSTHGSVGDTSSERRAVQPQATQSHVGTQSRPQQSSMWTQTEWQQQQPGRNGANTHATAGPDRPLSELPLPSSSSVVSVDSASAALSAAYVLCT